MIQAEQHKALVSRVVSRSELVVSWTECAGSLKQPPGSVSRQVLGAPLLGTAPAETR